MIKLNVNNNRIAVSMLEPLIVGSINSIFVDFCFSSEWDSLARLAVFSNGETRISVPVDNEAIAIPWEVLSDSGKIQVALRGLGDSGNYVICTENVYLGYAAISNATEPAELPAEATPNEYEGLLADVAALKDAEYIYVAYGVHDGDEFSNTEGTYSGIIAAYQQNEVVKLHLDISNVGTVALPLSAVCESGEVIFEAKYDDSTGDEYNFIRVIITPDDEWQLEYSDHATRSYVTDAIESAISYLDSVIGSGVIE